MNAQARQATRSSGSGDGRVGPKPAKKPNPIGSWFSHHLHSLRRSLDQLGERPVATAMTLSVIAIALALPATLLVLLNNLDEVTVGWSDAGQITVFLEQGSTQGQAQSLATTLTQDAAVDSVDVLSPDAALADFRALETYDPALDLLNDNPLPWTLAVTPRKDVATGELERLLSVLDVEPQIELAQFDRQWFARARALLDVAKRVTLLLAVLLGVAVILVVGNTIRMGIENRRAEIEISQVMGASDGFVRRPFLYSGLWQGLFGGFLAWCLVTIALLSLRGPVASLGATYGADYALSGLGGIGFLSLLGISLALGIAGSWVAVGRHLSQLD